ncbi:titin isoform X2 [Medicago truncatula]|uniref:titin isoform X2 n=1 Tax=Medicago truncatula TaxID=3880 RepID=UPI001967968C|nr:titin isoform X2 [Medicago truncatula]
MELELGLKITKTKDDIDSISEYKLMKDTGPIFQSRETNTMFILTAHLKGYKRNCIDIKISKDGSKISISGEKPIQEMVMMGWVMQRKVVDIKGFNKVFKIPYGVNLDKIKGNYNEEEWILNIYMPKLVKGIFGLKVEEVKEQENDKRKSELEKGEIDHVSSSVGETSQKESKDSEFQHMKGSDNGIEKMLDDNVDENNKETIQKGEEDDGIKRDVTECTIEKEKEESKLKIEDSKVNSTREIEKDVGKDISHNIVDTSQRVAEGSMIQKSGEPKEKEVGEKKGNSKENVVDHIPNTIDSISLNEFGKPKVPQMEKTNRNEGKMNGRESKKFPFEANEDVQKTKFGDIIQKGVTRAKFESQDEDQECVKEKLGKDGFDDAKITINEEFDKYLPKKSHEAREGLNVQKMEENKVVKENGVKRKGKEVEYLVENDDEKRLKMMHVEAKKGNTKETTQEEIEEIRESGIKESGQQPHAERGKGFNVAEEDQREVVKEAFVGTQSLMEKFEGEESKERTKAKRVQDEGKKIEPNEPFEGDTTRDRIEKEITNQNFQKNDDIGVFDGRKTQMFQEMEQKEYFKEDGENNEKSMKKLNGDKYQQIQNEEIGNSKQKEFGELECETKDRLKESSIEPFEPTKASKLEKNVVDHIPSNIDCINQNEFKEEYENPPFEAKEVVQKTLFGNIIKPKLETEDGDEECVRQKPNKEGFDAKITTNEKFPQNLPKNTHEESEGLNVKQMQETKDVMENVVKRKGKKIEYLVEKSEGERLKSKHNIEGKKGNNTRETMQEGEESENGIKESGQQHPKENIVKEKSEVSKNMAEELQHPVENINGNIGFDDVAEEEEQKEVMKEALVESESSMEKTQEEEFKERIVAKRVEDEENKIEYAIVKLKGEGFTKLNVEPNEPFEGDTTRDRIEKEIINQKFQENVDIGIFDGRKPNKFQEMEETELSKEKDSTIGMSMKKVNGEKYEKIQNEVDEGFKKNITKEKDDCYLQEKMSKDRSKEDFPMKMLDSQGDTTEEVKGRKIEKAKGIKEESEKVVPFVKGESEEPKSAMKIKDQQCLQEKEANDHEIEKAKKVKGQEAKRKSDEFIFGESTTKEEPQVQKAKDPKGIDTRTSERELQCERGPATYSTVESIGFKEFEYKSAKDKKQNTKALPPKFENKETQESKDESMSPKEVESIEDKVVKPLSTLRFQSSQQSEVEEKDKFCEGNKANYKGSIESKREDPTKDVQNLIEMKETLKPEIPREEEHKKGEKTEFLNGENVGETMQMETDEPKNRIDTKEKQHVAKVVTEKMDKGKCFDEKMKTTQEKDAESLESSQKNDIDEVKAKRPLELEMPDLQCEFPKTKDHVRAPELRDGEQYGYIKEGIEENKAPKIEASEGAKPSKLQSRSFNQQSTNEINRKPEFSIEEHKEEKESPKLNIVGTEKIDSLQPQILDGQEEVLDVPSFQRQKTLEEEKVVKRTKGSKIEKSEETKDTSTLKREKGKTTQTTEEKKPKIMETTPQFDMASGSKRESEKMQEASKRRYQRESEQVTPKMDVEPPITVEKTQIKKVEGKKHIQVLEETISKEKEDKAQQCVQEKNDKKGFQTPKTIEEKIVLKKMEGLKIAKSEEEKEKYQMEERTTPFDKACGSKRVADKVHEKVHETPLREHQREPEEFTSKIELDSPTTFEKPPRKKVERKEAHEFTRPKIMSSEIPKVEEVQEDKEVERHIHLPEASISKEERTQVTTTRSKEKDRVEPKGEVGMPQENQNLSPKEPFDSIVGSRILEAAADKVVQQFEVKGEDKTKKKDSKMSVQESEESKTRKEVEQCIIKDEEQEEDKDETSGRKKDNEIPKGEEEKYVERHIHVLEETVSKEETTTLEVVADKVVQESKFPSSSSTQQLEVEGEEKTKKKESKIDVQKERERHILVPEATISKEGTRVTITTTHSKENCRVEPKGEIGKPPKNQTPSPKEPFQSTEGSTLEAVADKEAQQFEVEEKEKTKKKDSKMDVQESTKSKTGKEVEECIIKDEETKHEIEQKEGKSETTGWKKHNEIPKVEEKKVERHIHVEAIISKEKDRVEPKEGTGTKQNFGVSKNPARTEPFYSMEGTTTLEAVADVQESKVSSSTSTQQFEVEREEKTKKRESKIDVQESTKSNRGQEIVEKCINKDEESKHGREEIDDEEEERDYEQVSKEQKEGKDETSEDKISKKLFIPFVIAAGSALLVTLVVMFVRHRKSRKR